MSKELRVADSEIQLDQLPGHLFRRLHQLAVARFTADMETISLTPIQWAAMVTTAKRPGAKLIARIGQLRRLHRLRLAVRSFTLLHGEPCTR